MQSSCQYFKYLHFFSVMFRFLHYNRSYILISEQLMKSESADYFEKEIKLLNLAEQHSKSMGSFRKQLNEQCQTGRYH